MRFFFFQAEDGIRDRTVTGVQTCALPISQLRRIPLGASRRYWSMTQHAQGSSSHRDMACACTRRAWAAWILVVLGGAVPSPAQTLTPAPERVAWPLVDFVTFGDSIHGVQF